MAQPSYSDYMTSGLQSYAILLGVAVTLALVLGYFDVFNFSRGASFVFLFLLGLVVAKLFYRQTRGGRDWFIVLLIAIPVTYLIIRFFLPVTVKLGFAVFLIGYVAGGVTREEGDELYSEARF